MNRSNFNSLIVLILVFLVFSCVGLKSKKLNDPSSGIGLLIQSDLCVSIGICPPEFYSAKEINQYIILNPPSIGIIKEKNINFIVPYLTNLNSLKAKFIYRGSEILVNSVPQVSEVTENNFTNPVLYNIKALDKTQTNFTVRATRASIDAKGIYAFKLKSPSVNGFILGNQISLFVPTGTNITNLVAEIFTTGASVFIGTAKQESGVSVNDFTTPKVYTVFAADGTSQDYSVSVSINQPSSNEIKGFIFESLGASGIISGNDITVTLPIGTSRINLVPSFSHNGKLIKVGTQVQVSGESFQNFSNTVAYTVQAENGSERVYQVKVGIATNTAKELTSFYLTTPPTVGSINQSNSTVDIIVPMGTNVRNLTPFFFITGSSVNVNGTEQVSGINIINFISPVTYTILAADGSSRDYIVNVRN